MIASKRLLTVLLAVALLAGAYFLGTVKGVPAASALDASAIDSKGLAAALSTAVYVSNHTVGSSSEDSGEMAAEYYNTFMNNAK